MFLGSFDAAQAIRFRVTWTPDVGSVVTGSTLTLTHPDGTVITVAGVAESATIYHADAILGRRGRWSVRWVTTPAGGARTDSIYVA